MVPVGLSSVMHASNEEASVTQRSPLPARSILEPEGRAAPLYVQGPVISGAVCTAIFPPVHRVNHCLAEDSRPVSTSRKAEISAIRTTDYGGIVGVGACPGTSARVGIPIHQGREEGGNKDLRAQHG